MAKKNGRIHLHPVLAWSIAVYLIGMGVGVGKMITDVSTMKTSIVEIKTTMGAGYRTRAEGDEVIKRFDHEISDLRERVGRIEAKNAPTTNTRRS